MTLQEQVCTLEQAKRLKELGCKQESYFYYTKVRFDKYIGNKYVSTNDDIQISQRGGVSIASAYTVAELGEMILVLDAHIEMPIFFKGTWSHYIFFSNENGDSPYFTEAQARAALLIHILEHEKEHDT